MSVQESFFQIRMREAGVTPDNNRIQVYDPEAEHPAPSDYIMPIFEEVGSTGDIEIYFYGVDGEVQRYEQRGDGKTASLNAKTKYYKITRLKEPQGDMKYRMPSGQPTRPWFPPALVEKFNQKTPIDTLVLTEGVFKAMRGSVAGLDIVGLPSITCYKGKDGKIYEDIARLIETCQVQKVVILWDGDCLNISRKDLQVGDELTNRPATFFNSAKKISELISCIEWKKNREKPSVYFAHVKTDSHPSQPKGLDDLLNALDEDSQRRAVKELSEQPDKPFFFVLFNISNGTGKMWQYFRLDDHKKFYDYHQYTIEGREFKFKGSIYRWSEVSNELVMQAPEWANRVKWVGDEFFLEDVVPGAVRDRRKLISYNQGQFTKMFGKDFWTFLQHHRAFVNIPDHFKYRQVIELADGAKYYNRYFPYPHVPTEGKWDNIRKLLLHIFSAGTVTHANGKEYQCLDLALDYIQLLLCKPTQMLPVLCLYSPENNTGKSTLGKLLMHMFGDNVAPIGNADLQSEFNELFTDKLLAICDETLLERRKDAERIKAMSTAEQITVNPKGQKQYSIDYFCKFIFTSNNLRMIYVNKHDQRYWILRVPVLTEDDPNMLEKMKAELPAFTYYLMNRSMTTEKESRMWFHPSLIRTRILDDMVRVNEPTAATDLRQQITDWFVADPDLSEIRMTLKEIKEEFFKGNGSVAWMQEILRDYIGVDLLRDEAGEAVFERGYYTKFEVFQNPEGEEDLRLVKKVYRGRPYQFLRSNFLKEGEVIYPANADTAVQPSTSQNANLPTQGGVVATAIAATEGNGELPF